MLDVVLASLCLTFEVEAISGKEDGDDCGNHECVDDKDDAIIHQHLEEAFLFCIFLVLAVAARETFLAHAISIATDSTVEALSEAFRYLGRRALEVSATVLVTFIRQPVQLHDALVAV